MGVNEDAKSHQRHMTILDLRRGLLHGFSHFTGEAAALVEANKQAPSHQAGVWVYNNNIIIGAFLSID